MSKLAWIKILSGPLLALFIGSFFDLSPGNSTLTYMAAVAAWMALWWFTEAVHFAVTALLPFVLMPLLGIADARSVAREYMDPIMFLFIGGFIIAFAIERWNLHQRIALRILMMVGTRPTSVLLGVMFTTYFISMWISNTATVMMMLSAVSAIIHETEKHAHSNLALRNNTSGALMTGLAYSASIGGMATLVGTPTNMIFFREYMRAYPNNHDMNFMSWFIFAFPLSVVLLLIAYGVIRFVFIRSNQEAVSRNYFKERYKALGKMNYEEKIVGALFTLTALLWFTRSDIEIGSFVMHGWGSVFGASEYVQDGTVAIMVSVLLFVIPSRAEPGKALITWKEASKIPYEIILLFGGGFAMAKGFELSGLSKWLASHIHFTEGSSLFVFILLLGTFIVVISEFSSNVACIQLMLPVLISLQPVMKVHPLFLLLPATLAASLGFMLPVATAPNTIVFGSGQIKMKEMMKAGIYLDIAGILLIAILSLFL